MGPVESATAMEYLSQAECWALLEAQPVGRIGVQTHTGPEVYPVNYVVDGATIVFRTAPGGKLASLTGHPSVCFEVDGIDPATRTGWSVLVKGEADQPRGDDLARLRHDDLEYWTVGLKPHWVRITPVAVTGRRIWPGHRTTTAPAAAEDDGPLHTRPAWKAHPDLSTPTGEEAPR